MNNSNRSTFLLDIITVVILAIVLIVLVLRLFVVRSPSGPSGPGGGAYVNPPARQAWVGAQADSQSWGIPAVSIFAR